MPLEDPLEELGDGEVEDNEPLVTGLQWDNGVSLLKVQGEIDLATVPELKAALTEAATSEKAAVVNLAGVTYMDSSGFATLLEAARHLKQRGASLHLVGPNKNIARLMEVTRLNTIFQIHDNDAAAREAVGLSPLFA